MPIRCTSCNDENPDGYLFCGNCGKSLPSFSGSPVSASAQHALILDKQIPEYISRGFHVIARTETTTQLLKPKSLGCFWGLFWLGVSIVISIFVPVPISCFLPILILLSYLAYYLTKKDEAIYLYVDPQGNVNKRG